MARKKQRAWSNQVGKLPQSPEDTLSPWYQEALRMKEERKDKTMQELKDEYAELEAADEKAATEQSARNLIYKALELRILEEIKKVQAVAGTDTWRGDGHVFSPKHTARPVIEDPAALKKWIEDTNQLDQLTLPTGRLNAIITEAFNTDMSSILTPAQRAMLKPGDPGSGQPPPGVKVFLQTSVHHTAPRAKPSESSDDGDDGPF